LNYNHNFRIHTGQRDNVTKAHTSAILSDDIPDLANVAIGNSNPMFILSIKIGIIILNLIVLIWFSILK